MLTSALAVLLGMTGCGIKYEVMLDVQPDSGFVVTEFSFTATASSSNNNVAPSLEVRWDWENDGVYDTEWQDTVPVSHKYHTIGNHTVRLQVRNGEELLGDTTHVITIYPGGGRDEFTLVPAGTFTMGGNIGDDYNERPAHQVTLTHDFYLGSCEVTNKEYVEAVQWAYDQGLVTASSNTVQSHMEELLDLDDPKCEISFNGGMFTLDPVYRGKFKGQSSADHPVKEVSWYGAACYCDWLSLMAGLPLFYNGSWEQSADHNPYAATGYRLPTEAEWEYAARYPDNLIYPWGDEKPNCEFANFDPTHWSDGGSRKCANWTVPVGSLSLGASQLGLMDMAGNLEEWVNNGIYSYGGAPLTDPLTSGGRSYGVRGGHWNSYMYVSNSDYNTRSLRCSRRHSWGMNDPHYIIGFRVARAVQF